MNDVLRELVLSVINLNMRKVALALALLFCADVALDSFDASCAQSKSDQPCHACLCQTHILLSTPAASARIDAPRPTFAVTAFEPAADRLIDKTVFRPPIALA